MRVLRSLLLAAAAVGLLAQAPDSLPDRIRSSSLPAGEREDLLRALDAKDYARAESILNRQAASAEVRALAGAIEFLRGRMAEAAAAFHQSDALEPLSDRDRFTFAMALVNLSDAAAARKELDRLNAAHADRPLYLYWLGRMDYEQRLYHEAAGKFRRVIQLDPVSSRAYDNLGLTLDMLGEQDEARAAMTKAVELNRKLAQPSGWPPHNLGALLLRMQHLPEAETALRESLRYDPGLAMTHYHLGRVLDAAGRDEESIEEYRAATSANPPVLEAFYSLGLVYRRNERAAEAEAAFAEYRKRK